MPDTSQKTSSSDIPNPAVLRYRGLDLEAMTALQSRNINTIRRMTNLMVDGTEAIIERQAAFLKAGPNRMNATFESREATPDPKALFDRQAEAYRDLFDSFAVHVSQLAEITSTCCNGLIQEAVETGDDRTNNDHLAGSPERPNGANAET